MYHIKLYNKLFCKGVQNHSLDFPSQGKISDILIRCAEKAQTNLHTSSVESVPFISLLESIISRLDRSGNTFFQQVSVCEQAD